MRHHHYQADPDPSARTLRPADDPQWTSRQVAELIELAYSTALHQARVCPIEALEHEVQDFEQRVAARAQMLEHIRRGRMRCPTCCPAGGAGERWA